METSELILAAVAVFAGATLQSAIGFGFALIAGPAMFAALEPPAAVVTLYALGTILNTLVLAGEARGSEVRTAQFTRVIAWSLPGVVGGVFVLLALSKPSLQVVVGICVVIAVTIHANAGLAAETGASRRAEAAAGLAAGTLTTTTATSGPPLVLLLRHDGARPEEFRDTMAALLLALNILGAGALLISGEDLDLPGLAVFALLAALVVAARPGGRFIFDHLDERVFRVAGLALIAISGVASIVAGFLTI